MFRAAGIVLALILVCMLHEAKAAVRPVKPETRQDRPATPLEREAGTVPCLLPPGRPHAGWWMLVGPNGETLIIGAHEVRQRC